MAKTRRPIDRLRELDHLRPDRRSRFVTAPIRCPGCGRGDSLVRVALAGGADEVCSVYSCSRTKCRRSIRLRVGIGLAPRITVEDVSGELSAAIIGYGPELGPGSLVASSDESE